MFRKQGEGHYQQQRMEDMVAAEDWAGGWVEVAKEVVVKEGVATEVGAKAAEVTEVGAKAAEVMEGVAMEGAAMEAVAMEGAAMEAVVKEAEGCFAQGFFCKTQESTIACHRGEHH